MCLLRERNGYGKEMQGQGVPASVFSMSLAGEGGWGPKSAAAYLQRHPEQNKSNYYFPHFEITQRGSSILLQIEFHKPSKQFGLSLRNRLSGSSLSDSAGGGWWLLMLILAACWSQHKSPITIQNTITFFTPLTRENKKPFLFGNYDCRLTWNSSLFSSII